MTVIYVLLAIVSCCSNVALLEILIREVPACGNVITFFQFFFIAVEGFIFTSKFGTVKPVVPVKNYILLVLMFFAVSVSNNYALNFNIPMPLHMIFKSGSLVTSMLLGMLILKRRYTVLKYISVLMVSAGILIATWASQHVKSKEELGSMRQSLTGIALLSFALVLSALLGIYQENIFRKYGKHPKEALFYSHALPLPGFLLLANDIFSQLPYFFMSAPVEIFSLCSIPKLWLCLIGNVLTQYICVRSVFMIAARYSSLTVTMIITFRKFISLLFSVIYFENPFTAAHWFGTCLVFLGTVLFADIWKFQTEIKKIK